MRRKGQSRIESFIFLSFQGNEEKDVLEKTRGEKARVIFSNEKARTNLTFYLMMAVSGFMIFQMFLLALWLFG